MEQKAMSAALSEKAAKIEELTQNWVPHKGLQRQLSQTAQKKWKLRAKKLNVGL